MFSTPPASRASKWLAFFIGAILMFTCLSVFYIGFFPAKVLVPGEASHATNEPMIGSKATQTPHSIPVQKFSRIIFMLVDSLRTDFVTNPSSGFSFVRHLLQEGKAYVYKAHAHPPTVTLPRVKALVTGGIPSFRDYVANFQSSAIDQDNMVWQMQRHGKCLVFYGDETWLKLFPSAFTRYEGTTSFFVADTVEVDKNVTRNLPRELERYTARTMPNLGSPATMRTPPPESSSHKLCDPDADWDVMFLHYLGLDHIGHLQGPRSPLMYPKQVEMNAIFENLYKTIDKETLLIMSGDHGMNEEGAHGGPSDGETSPALVLASPAFNSKSVSSDRSTTPRETTTTDIPIPTRIDQIDLVPTLSTLFGIPTPLNSVGKLIPNVLEDLYRNEPEDLLRAYQLNAAHIHRLLKTSAAICKDGSVSKYHMDGSCVGMNDEARQAVAQLLSATQFHESYASSLEAGQATSSSNFDSALHSYQDFLKTSSSLFTHALSEYDDYLLFSAISGLAVCAAFGLLTWKSTLISHPPWVLVAICALAHFVADSFILISMGGSALASTALRVLASLLLGYCIAHILVVTRTYLKTNFSDSESYFTSISTQAASFGQAIIASEFGLVGAVLLVGLAIRPLVYSSSSFIEEEHLTFFYMSCTAMMALMHTVLAGASDVGSSALTLGVVLFAMRSCRLWNQSGFQGIGKPDMVRMLHDNPELKNLLIFITFAGFASYVVYHLLILINRAKSSSSSVQISFNRLPVNLHRLLLRLWLGSWCLSIFCAFVFQCTGTHSWASIAHYGNFACLLIAISWLFLWRSPDSNIGLSDSVLLLKWSILAISFLICRHNNVPLIGLWILQSHGMLKLSQGFSTGSSSLKDRLKDWIFAGSLSSSSRHGAVRPPIWVWSLLLYNLGQYAYFSQGNSNSLASIDIAGAYAGLSGYQDALVGFFVMLLLYAGPLTFQLTLLIILVQQDQEFYGSASNGMSLGSASGQSSLASHSGEHSLHVALLDVLRIRLVGRSWALVIYSIFITAHRGHLFIWSVFAPKLLYEIFHSIAFGLQIVGLVGFCAAQLKRKKEDALPMRNY